MTAFQLQTFVPQDGKLSITLPVYLRETDVDMFISKRKDKPPRLSKEEREKYVARINSFRGTLHDIDDSPVSDEEYLEGIRSLRGILTGTLDYSDLREKTDREL